MTRGNQRETDRARAQARVEKNAPKESQGDLTKRRERDAQIMKEKQKQALEKKAAEASGDSSKKK
eukprot:CAMPEP_0196655636 /NCGR_PEP_ID=MMETSP1086-20130531/5387_1 /TAXON_ID=77921 /ORGANISM="Cyanoptyche  gloeocystis , Strain SAG4.97" /LENGTH=64 /DNA_ID=CAMNT_0041988051 /DNA_START=46 /DNA_END=240 /DNA_ORIENTATION=+